jgi:hypothetical protein
MTYGARMSREPIGLFDGIKLPATDLKGIQADVTFFVASGGCVFITVNGRTRYALVPTQVGEDYLATRRGGHDHTGTHEHVGTGEHDRAEFVAPVHEIRGLDPDPVSTSSGL